MQAGKTDPEHVEAAEQAVTSTTVDGYGQGRTGGPAHTRNNAPVKEEPGTEEPPSTRNPMRTVGRILRRLWRLVFTAILVSAIAVGGFVAYGSVTGKFRVTTMLTGSMANVLPVGSLVLVEPQNAQTLEVGDIIAFIPPEREDTTIHRVMEIVEWDPQPIVVTKGDMNNGEDPWVPMRIDQENVWKPKWMIPHVGEALLWLQNTRNRVIAAGAVALVLWLRLMWGIWQGKDDDEYDDDDTQRTAEVSDGSADGNLSADEDIERTTTTATEAALLGARSMPEMDG